MTTTHEPTNQTTKLWSLMQLERQLRPGAYGWVRGGYVARRRPRTTGTLSR
jgi:hypothetical protein